MNLSFFPGELHLKQRDDGTFVITVQAEEVFSSKVEKKAIAEYNRIRKDMEKRFPLTPLSPAMKTELLMKYLAKDFHSNTFKPPKKQGKAPGSTRTFG